MKKNILILLILFASISLFSQTDSLLIIPQDVLDFTNLQKPKDLDDQKVISASRTSKSISDLPVTIYVITRQEIIENGYVTLVDALKSVPGIRTSQPGSGEFGEMFQMRGMLGNNYTKILINGTPIKSSVVVGLPISAQIPIRQAERIEIIYGPASALYGADATVGVINIITKEATTGIFAHADVNLTGDGYANFHVGGKAGKNKNILNYSLYGSIRNVRNIGIYGDESIYRPLSYLDQEIPAINLPNGETMLLSQMSQDEYNTFVANTGNDFFAESPNFEGTVDSVPLSTISSQSYFTGFNLNYKAFSISAINMHRKNHSSLGRSTFFYKYNNPQNFFAEHTDLITTSYKKQIKKVYESFSISFTRNYLDPNSSYGVNFTPDGDKMYQYYEANDIFAEQMLTYNYKFFEIVFGLTAQFSADRPFTNYLNEPFDPNDVFTIPKFSIEVSKDYDEFGDNFYAFNSFAQFVQTYFDFKNLKVMLGARNDYNSLFDTASISPRAAAIYKFGKNFSVRGSYGQAFKPPAGNQIFNSLAFQSQTPEGDTAIYYAFLPNVNLKPEYFSSLETGIRMDLFQNKVQLDISTFHNRTKNLITAGTIDPKELGYENSHNPDIQPARIYVNSTDAEVILDGVVLNLRLNNIIDRKFKLSLEVSTTTIISGREVLPNGDEIDFYRGVPRHTGKFKTDIRYGKRWYFKIFNYASSSWQRQYLPYKDYYANDYYKTVPGYFVSDFVMGFRFHRNLNLFWRINNLGDKNYAGIAVTGTDVDLYYNPQRGTSSVIGMSFLLN